MFKSSEEDCAAPMTGLSTPPKEKDKGGSTICIFTLVKPDSRMLTPPSTTVSRKLELYPSSVSTLAGIPSSSPITKFTATLPYAVTPPELTRT